MESVYATQARATRTRVGLAALALTLAAAWSAKPAAGQSAHAARSLSVKDEGDLHLVKTSGSLLIDEGPIHGAIPGRAKVRFVYNGDPAVSAQLTIYGRAGSLRVRAKGRLSSPTSPRPSFEGTLTVVGGSGRYAHAHGSGRLYGVFYRRTYAMKVQTVGAVHY